ncbi:MAG: hypothetical protein ACLQF1_20420 [Methyloceanibacter sp.]
MFEIDSGFIGNFKLGDNINHNLAIMRLFYEQFDRVTNYEKRLLCKPIILLQVSIIEAVLYDLHTRIRMFTWEGVRNLTTEAINHVRASHIDKLDKYIASARRHDFFELADSDYYDRLEELRRLRNRIHIQNEKRHFEADEWHAFNEQRKVQAERALEKTMRTMASKFMRPPHTHYVGVFELPWVEHFPEY